MGEHTMAVLDVEQVRSRVTAAIDGFVRTRILVLGEISPDLLALTEALTELLHTGKRLRPAFCWWGWRAAGGANVDSALLAASSLELLQASALIHDDVMDASDMRRGNPSMHRRFEAEHRLAQWRGSPQAFGSATAILLGDACLSWVEELYAESGLSASDLERGRPFLNLMKTEVIAGQYLDMLEQARGGGSVERALTVARYKTAKYTIERPLQLGGALAGAPPEVLTAYSEYGLPLGEAFQLRDDMLGVFGDPAQTGKPAGDDLREGKRTVLIATAFANASDAASKVLVDRLGRADLTESEINEMREIIDSSGASTLVETLIRQRIDKALQAIDVAPIYAAARQTLIDLASAATSRNR